MEFLEALEESLKELGIDNLDDNPNDIPVGTDETAEDESPEDEADDSQPVEDDSDDEQEDEGDESGPVLEIVDNAKLKLQDGTVVSAKEVLFRQADYTRKTQELAEQRRIFDEEQADYLGNINQIEQQFQQVNDWYQERSSRPSEWIAEIASGSSDPTSTLAKALYDLAQTGVLDRQFVESFGIESDMIREKAEKHDVTNELEEIKAWRRQQEEEQNRRTLVQQQIQRYEGEWQSIKGSRDLSFGSPAEELALKQDLLQFALENNMTRSLVDAYDLMTVRKPRVSKKRETDSPDVSDKKRASRAVTPKTAVSGQSKRTKKVVSDREAILEAMEAISL
jgi:hypothetical protein